jgi:pilus assembly protein CpaB
MRPRIPHRYAAFLRPLKGAASGGFLVKTRIFRGEPVTEIRLIPKGEHGGLQVRIPTGMRAMSLKIDSEVGVSGFIEPGSRVDVIASLPLERGERLTKVVLQNILVLAVGHELESENNKPKETTTVTLALSPEEAERLALARSEGQVMLALRNLRDDRISQTPGFSRFELATIRPSAEEAGQHTLQEANPREDEAAKPQEPPPPPSPKYHVVELLQGEEASQVKFEIPP